MATYTKPLRPYLFDCYYQWMIDNNPFHIFIQADTTVPLLSIPSTCNEYISPQDSTIVFNISPQAIQDFKVHGDIISFKTRFRGIVHELEIPFSAVLSIYSQPLKFGMDFPQEQYYLEWIKQHSISISEENQERNAPEPDQIQQQTEGNENPKPKNILKIIE